jgi:TRAP-type transport system small permease protein
MRLAAAATAIDRGIGRGARAAVVALASAIFALMLAGVVGRHVLSEGLPALTELPEQLFPWFVMAAIVLAAQARAHVAVEWLTLVVGAAWRARLTRFAQGVTLALGLLVVWSVGCVALVAGGDRSPVLDIPLLHMHVALALGFALVALLAACALARPLDPPA